MLLCILYMLTGQEPYVSVDGEWEPVSSEDEAEMNLSSVTTTTQPSSHQLGTPNMVSRFPFRSNTSVGGAASGLSSSGILTGRSGFANMDQPSTSSGRASNSSSTVSPSLLNLSPGFHDTSQRRSAYNTNSASAFDSTPSQTPLYSTSSNLEQDSLIEDNFSSSHSGADSSSSSNSPTSFTEQDIGNSSLGLSLVDSTFRPNNNTSLMVGRPSIEEDNSDMDFESDDDSYEQFVQDL